MTEVIKKQIWVNGTYIDPRAGQEEIKNMLLINGVIQGIGYLPDDDDAQVYDCQGTIMVPYLMDMVTEGSPFTTEEEACIHKSGFMACGCVDPVISDRKLAYYPYPYPIKRLGRDSEVVLTDQELGVFSIRTQSQLDQVQTLRSTGRQFWCGVRVQDLIDGQHPWLVEAVMEDKIDLISTGSRPDTSVIPSLVSLFYHQHKWPFINLFKLLTHNPFQYMALKPKGCALANRPSFTVIAPMQKTQLKVTELLEENRHLITNNQLLGRVKMVVINGDIVYSEIEPGLKDIRGMK